MTQEEKAKRYDEALEELRGLLEGVSEGNYPITKDDIIEIFPELKEDNDEKIRKAIVSGMTTLKELGKETFATININDCISWLEKQGEHRQDPCKHCKMTYSTCYSFPCDEKKAFEQGKTALEAINEEKVDNANNVEPKDYSSIDPHFGKSIDKVGPKFHKGDWIVVRGEVILICDIRNDLYDVIFADGEHRVYDTNILDKESHLWTIKDAKDGDILASKTGNKIFSYRGYLDLRGNPCAYYGIYKVHDGICFSPCAIGNSFTWEEVFPATKEQRKILFEERTAAGGVLHFSKKELKKIEDDKVVIKKGEKPATWSEEDKVILDEIIDFFENGTVKLQHDLSLYASWLKSLKERVGCGANCIITNF